MQNRWEQFPSQRSLYSPLLSHHLNRLSCCLLSCVACFFLLYFPFCVFYFPRIFSSFPSIRTFSLISVALELVLALWLHRDKRYDFISAMKTQLRVVPRWGMNPATPACRAVCVFALNLAFVVWFCWECRNPFVNVFCHRNRALWCLWRTKFHSSKPSAFFSMSLGPTRELFCDFISVWLFLLVLD